MDISQVWPEWKEDCVLGEGSFGKVFRAKRVEYGRTFYSAIKVLTVPKNQQEIKYARSQGMNDDEIYAYFRSLVDNLLNEITLMDNLKGAKNIVGIEDYKIIERQGEIGWDIFIRMELLTPFDSFVSSPDFSQKDVIRLGVDICTALEGCEQNQILHRDIKPDNIFISRFGEYKLGDFGIAKKLETTQANLSRKGTLNYMAPEVYKSEEYGSSVDIYSLGLVLYTLLNNNRIAFLPPYPQPITYKDNEEALTKRLSGEPLTYPCNASPSLGQVIVKACAYRPQDRYQSAAEFKAALIQEWNVLVQSGDNKEIHSDAMRFQGAMDQRMQSTTNDMTANGRLVVNEYAQGTTVLDQQAAYYDNTNGGSAVTYSETTSETAAYPTGKSSKLSRVLSWVAALFSVVLSLAVLMDDGVGTEATTAAMAMLGIGAGVLLSDRNNRAIGLGMLALSFPYIVTGLGGVITNLEQRLDIPSVIMFVCGALILFGGIVITTQKEARFGGSLGMYALVIEWAYCIYQLIYHNFSMDLWRIALGVSLITILTWAYGYNSAKQQKNVLKWVLWIAALLIGVAVLVQGLIYVVPAITGIFG